ncbi:MAG: hypothetical protein ACP5TV_05685 [Anaerolineae bacterium]
MDRLAQRIRERAHDNTMPCTAAHAVAWELDVSPQKVGEMLNQMQIPITLCQLGLFGYGPKAEGKSKLLRPMTRLDSEIEARLRAREREGRISCRTIWDIARELNVERLIVANIADAMGLRITPCQLGCF